MRTMKHNSRTNASGKTHGSKHNDRNFDISKAENIDQEKSKDNIYWNCFGDEQLTFEAVELNFYEEKFSSQLEEINNNYIKNRHPERCKTMVQWKKLKQNAPEETTYQIGRKYDDKGKIIDEYVGAPELMKVYREYDKYLQEWNQSHGCPFTTLTKALHVDEAVPHIQVRQVWHYTDKNGKLKIGQERALEAAGVPLPFPDKPVGRRNNRKMTFDAMMRDKWIDICHSHGIDVEREALPAGKGKKSKDKEEYIREKYEEALTEVAELTEIKTIAERDAAASEVEQGINEVIGTFEKVDNFITDLQVEKARGGLMLKNIIDDFLWDWRQVRERTFVLLSSLAEKIRSIDIFEKIKQLPAFERKAPGLQERLNKATRDSEVQNKAASEAVQRSQTEKEQEF